MARTTVGAATLRAEQLEQYREQGFLAVAEPFLPEDAITFARERIDGLFDRWPDLPRRLAPGPSSDGPPPPIARIHRPAALDPALAHCELLEMCRGLAASMLEAHKVWCRFDGAVYKHPGAGDVHWHRDISVTTLGAPKRSVHFWIPLNDHADDSGSLMFIPGSHQGRTESVLSRFTTHSRGAASDAIEDATPVEVPLSLGSFSIHTPWTLHGSRPNASQQIRKALVLEFSPGAWSAARQIGPALVAARLPSVRSAVA